MMLSWVPAHQRSNKCASDLIRDKAVESTHCPRSVPATSASQPGSRCPTLTPHGLQSSVGRRTSTVPRGIPENQSPFGEQNSLTPNCPAPTPGSPCRCRDRPRCRHSPHHPSRKASPLDSYRWGRPHRPQYNSSLQYSRRNLPSVQAAHMHSGSPKPLSTRHRTAHTVEMSTSLGCTR